MSTAHHNIIHITLYNIIIIIPQCRLKARQSYCGGNNNNDIESSTRARCARTRFILRRRKKNVCVFLKHIYITHFRMRYLFAHVSFPYRHRINEINYEGFSADKTKKKQHKTFSRASQELPIAPEGSLRETKPFAVIIVQFDSSPSPGTVYVKPLQKLLLCYASKYRFSTVSLYART